ncbi:MAG TPA: type II secretion system F family protein [Paracoccaceae bacterium]|nr:type II secretion system F family protein [Paracoccaceae bacterium]
MKDPGTAVLPPELVPVAVFVLVLSATAGMLYLVFQDRLSGRAALRHRLELAGGPDPRSPGSAGPISEHRRKQSIEKALSEMAQRERAKQRARLTVRMRLNQAGLAWSIASFYARVAVVAVIGIAAVHLGVGLALPIAAPIGGVAGFLALHFYVRSMRASRMKHFLAEFPSAIDIVTRGVKTGLPMGDCLKAIASEGQEPVRTEFRRIVDDLSVGLSLAQALTRFTHRVPIMEANFFAVVVTIQSQLGGNLSEALGNLSRVLRERKLMKEKIRAFSAEATASGAIIASMPVVVAGILSLTSPDYIGLLLTEFAGNIVLATCAVWMVVGVVVMRKMIRFDY